MRCLVTFLFLSLSLPAFSSLSPLQLPARDSWAFGVGFGTESDYDSLTVLEIKTPTLISVLRGSGKIGLVLSYETKEVSIVDREITPIHLLIELASTSYKDLVRTYVRLGGGSVLVDDPLLFSESNFFNMQFQLGIDIITSQRVDGIGSSFFIQAMVNAPAIRNPPLGDYPEIYDGTSLAAGLRMYF